MATPVSAVHGRNGKRPCNSQRPCGAERGDHGGHEARARDRVGEIGLEVLVALICAPFDLALGDKGEEALALVEPRD